MYQVIARKYRPQSFDDVLNQEHIKTTLLNAIEQNRIAHGYIFSGQRGTGKTTSALILARCLNCIQCTTESHKIPATIASRCQHFSFRSVDFVGLIQRMKEICEQEGVEADEETLSVIAQAGEGSVRDSLSALDQAIACCGNKLDAAAVRSLLGAFGIDAMAQVTDALARSDGGALLALVDELERNGGSPQHFSRELSRYLRNLLVVRIAGKDSRLVGASPAERTAMEAISKGFS